MAKRRKASRRKSFFGRAKARARRGSGVASLKPFQLDAVLYGAVRGATEAKVYEFSSKILPSQLAQFADEIGFGVIDYMVAKNTSGMTRNIALKGLIAENVSVGKQLGSMMMGQITNTTQNAGW